MGTRAVVHVWPVPRHMTPQDALEELMTFGRFVEYRWWKPRWWLKPSWWVTIIDEHDDEGSE